MLLLFDLQLQNWEWDYQNHSCTEQRVARVDGCRGSLSAVVLGQEGTAFPVGPVEITQIYRSA